MSFGRTKCDRSVVSDLKTVRIPCCSRQIQRGFDTSWMAVDLTLPRALFLGTTEEGYPLETSTNGRCFFSSAITGGLITRRSARSYRHFTIPRFTD